MSSTKIIEFDNVKFSKNISSKMVFQENFLGLTVTVRIQKNEYFKNVNFLILFFIQ